MNIMGSVVVSIPLGGFLLQQDLKVLNAQTYKNVLVGRDFLSNFDAVQFDMACNKIKLGTEWFVCVSSKRREPVRVQSNVSLPPRSESIVNVKCSKSLSLITADFEPKAIIGIGGVYATCYRIVPDLEGVFQVTLFNVNNDKVALNSRKLIGTVSMVKETVPKIKPEKVEKTPGSKLSINHGNALMEKEQDQLRALISQYEDIFAANPRKPTPVRNMTHRIITDKAQPVCMKPYRIPHAWNKEVGDQVQQMLDNEIIRPSSSP